MSAKLPNWMDRTVVCIASGPSLTPEDCELVKKAGYPAIVTNTTFRMVPWASIVFGFDSRWWKHYREEVVKTCPDARRMTASQVLGNVGVETIYGVVPGFVNSGAVALAIAVAAHASKVVLLGYDCQKTGGMTHWHGDHPKQLGNALSIDRWPRQMQLAADYASKQGVSVVNASRVTALKCFDRADLEVALQISSAVMDR